MSLFQKSVVNKYLANLDSVAVAKAYEQFQQFYGDAERIDNIRLLKEENYQEGFLREIFVDVLGYTINPNKNYNLTTEFKNLTDSKKADGAILLDEKAIGVIELKSTSTPYLESIREQAFNYKNNQTNCRFVITSNFEKLRFYIDNATDWEEFNLFNLDFENFRKFYLFLCKDSIFNGITTKLKDESKLHEEDITSKLYNDYSFFKHQLFNDLIKLNPSQDKLLLFHKSQKLLDRILFVLFAEDRGLLPPNAITRIIDQWKTLKDLDEEKSLYSRFVKLFHHLDEGHKYKEYELPAYNGGLFKKDIVLDCLVISDEILNTNTVKLSSYDFNTEVDVNILGHIFENSITEIEQVKAEIEGEQADKNRSRRKKEGIFYTPKYITKYIVDNTVGALCNEKKKELGIDEIENEILENSRTSKGKLSKKAETLLKKLDDYRAYLLSLKILDPACGSGAFLNQALEFLINEHELIDSYRRELEKDSLGLYDTTKSILENNLYGVDINEEAVEIAKLSLWIRTAERGRKLSDLNSNIKCGNSLIDDPTVAGDKAFDWKKEFPAIMKDGGFDVVIGNPPYVRAELLKVFKSYFEKKYKVYNPGTDLFGYFYELTFNVLNEQGVIGFISNTFNKTKSGISLRSFLQDNFSFQKYIDFTEFQVFNNATTYPIIFIGNKNEPIDIFNYIKISKDFQPANYSIDYNKNELIFQNKLDQQNWTFEQSSSNNLIEKIKLHKTIRSIFGKSYRGLITGLNEAYIVERNVFKNKNIKPIYEGKDIHKWSTLPAKSELILFKSGWTNKHYPDQIEKLHKDFSDIFTHLKNYELKAKARYDKGEYWWELRQCAYYDLFDKPKIIFPNLQSSNKFCFDDNSNYLNAPAVFLPTDDLALLGILNSNVVWHFLKSICVVRSGGFIEVKPQYFEQIPIPDYEDSIVEPLKSLVVDIISLSKTNQEKQNTFLSRIQSNFTIDKPSNKLKEFYDYDFKTFLSELKKKKIPLTLKQQDEWEQYFNEYKTEINTLQQQINQTDKEIDQLVYKLYGLTEEEIKIVEASVK
jgi:type I restriction-modification system DNA methylase subunit